MLVKLEGELANMTTEERQKLENYLKQMDRRIPCGTCEILVEIVPDLRNIERRCRGPIAAFNDAYEDEQTEKTHTDFEQAFHCSLLLLLDICNLMIRRGETIGNSRLL